MKIEIVCRLMILFISSPSILCESLNNNVVDKSLESIRKRKSSPPRIRPIILHSPRITNWGNWLDYFSTCPNETFVVGMQLKTDAFHGNHNNGGIADNTALNGVKFLCARTTFTVRASQSSLPDPNSNIVVVNITNQQQKWGKWGRLFMCRKGHVAVGFQLRVRKALPGGSGYGFKMDDVATCNMRLFCSDGQWLEGDGRNEWGRWTRKQQTCPGGYAICSLKTQVESDQFMFDDTALNNIDVGCCPFENDAVHVDDEEEDYIPEKPVADSNLDGSEPNHELPFFQNKAALGCLKILTIVKKAVDYLWAQINDMKKLSRSS